MFKEISHWNDALDALKQGNERFAAGLRSAEALSGHSKLKNLAENGQKPFAVILSCSDSRVPAELLFDCGFGDLFVVRVAGNVVQPSQVASIEYAAKVLGVRLCVVMGHTKCGAVTAALDSETGKKIELGPNIAFLIDLISPAVRRCLRKTEAASSTDALLEACVWENVGGTAEEILGRSEMLRAMTSEDRFQVVQAVFRLETGQVEFGRRR